MQGLSLGHWLHVYILVHQTLHQAPASPVLQGKLSNTEVDQRMVKALSDLPSELGLEAVDKFATSNLDSVRSKTGFMVRLGGEMACCGSCKLACTKRVSPCSSHAACDIDVWPM